MYIEINSVPFVIPGLTRNPGFKAIWIVWSSQTMTDYISAVSPLCQKGIYEEEIKRPTIPRLLI